MLKNSLLFKRNMNYNLLLILVALVACSSLSPGVVAWAPGVVAWCSCLGGWCCRLSPLAYSLPAYLIMYSTQLSRIQHRAKLRPYLLVLFRCYSSPLFMALFRCYSSPLVIALSRNNPNAYLVAC